MNFKDHYFTEKKKKKKKKSSATRRFSMASYFNSKKYDKGVHGTLDVDPGANISAGGNGGAVGGNGGGGNGG